ncbi:metallophosphoesterase [Actinoplanes sp. TBRC 11911]|uniref:metallophosphoesterase family protein n=1 Tax=Actinoplanes sp. TBRC 11911 TaxID=2729386 RepID=UPI00145ED359|nr:metallophosphoesterase [Actinoplanes sp. TBRC 11911]NMO52270.1 metallophosphoesterase [Actinoplanes sp. TBRC 11911]
MPGADGLVVAHVSDLHLGADDPAAVGSLAADVAAARPVLTVVTGDFVMRAYTEQFRRAAALLDSLPDPVLAVSGNHDLPLLSPRRLLSPYGRFRRWIDDDLAPVVRVRGITAVGLQSSTRWRFTQGRVARRPARAAAATLAAAPAGDLRLLAMHHPPPQLLWHSRLPAADLLLAGHTHLPAVRPLPPHGTLVVAGTATSRRTRGIPPSWSLLTVGPDELQVRERYLGPDGWYTGRSVRCPMAGFQPLHAS